jgi:hypothetical protein
MTTPISDLERLRAAMQADDGERADFWNPQPNDMLVGTVESYSVGQTRVGERRICNVRDADSGMEVAVWLSRSMLQQLFEEKHPQVGDQICVKYFGVTQPKRAGGSEYHRYALGVVRRIPATSNQSAQPQTTQSVSIRANEDDGPDISWNDLENRDLPF